MQKANALALKAGLSRKVLSVRFDDKRGQWCITHETSVGIKDTDGYRCDVDYYMFDHEKGFDVGKALLAIKAQSTLTFLGLTEWDGASDEAVKPKRARDKAQASETKVEAKSEDEVGQESEVETTVEVQEKPKRARKPKAKVEAKQESEADPMGLDDDAEEEEDENNQIYLKNKSDHAIHLRDIVEDKYGAEWKKDKKAVTVVKGLVAKLHNTVAVMDGNGEVLQSFVDYVGKQLKAA